MTEANNNTETNKLDNLTVRRFARLLKNDGAKTGSPVTTGTVAQNGNSLVVYADGAMIPITQTSTGVNVGDEVTVIYGDEQAYIVGNNTDNSPTASDLMNAEIDAERAAAELIKQERAKIDTETDTVRQKAQDASDKADALEKDLDASNATITDLSTEVGTLGTRVGNAVETANESLSTATEVKQTASDLSAKVDRAYENADEALTQSSTAQQTATEIQTTLSTNYYTKGEIEKSYVSESQLTQKANEITTSVKEDIASEYATTEALSEVKQTADGVSLSLSKDYTKTGEDTNYTQQLTFDTTVEGLTAKINSTGDDARKYATNYLKFDSIDGLVVGDMTKETLGANTQIISNGIRLRNGETVLGSFLSSGIVVGQTTGNNTFIDDDTILLRNGYTALAQFTADRIILGQTDSAHTSLSASNGLIIYSGSTETARFGAYGARVGKLDNYHTNITDEGVDICDENNKAMSYFGMAEIRLGLTSDNNVVVDTNGITVNDGSTALASFTSSKATIGKTSSNNVVVNSNGMTINNGTTPLAKFTANNILIGKTSTGENNTYIDSSGIQLRNGTTALAKFTTDGVTIGKTDSNNVIVDTSGLTVNDGTTALANFTSTSATIGKTSSNNVVVDTSGMTVKDGSTPYISMSYDSSSIGGAMIGTLNKKPLKLSTACDINGDGTWSGNTRSGYLSSWIEKDTTLSNWHILTYIKQSVSSYFYVDMIYSGSSSATSSAIQINYPGNLKLTKNYPYYANVATRETGTTSSYAGYVQPNSTALYFYPSNTVGTHQAVQFTVHVCGYFTYS